MTKAKKPNCTLRFALGLYVAGALVSACQEKTGQGFEGYHFVDLSHTYDETTLYWPTSPSGFDHDQLDYGMTEGGYFYSSYTIATPEHGGTHIDAPIHFAAGRETVDQIPLDTFFLKAFIIDVREKANADPDYRLTVGDIHEFEAVNGRIADGSAVLLMTDWSQYWPNALTYMGDDTPGDATQLHFPSFGEEAVKFLIEERKVKLIGVDTASIDYGPSQDFPVHRLTAAHNIPGLEDLTGLEELPATGALLVALPMKIGGGSGAPVRVVGLIPSSK